MFELLCRRNAYIGLISQSRKIDEDFERHLGEQVSLSRWISRLSPFTCFSVGATELTGTGLLEKSRYIQQVRDYQKVFAEYGFSEWLRMEQIELEIHGTDQKMPDWPSDDYPAPQFAYTPPSGTEYLHTVIVDAGIMAGVTLVFFLLSFVAFLRYDVR